MSVASVSRPESWIPPPEDQYRPARAPRPSTSQPALGDYTPPPPTTIQDYDAEEDDFYTQNGAQPVPAIPVSVATQSVRAPSPPPAAPILDHSHLRPGSQAALLSHEHK